MGLVPAESLLARLASATYQFARLAPAKYQLAGLALAESQLPGLGPPGLSSRIRTCDLWLWTYALYRHALSVGSTICMSVSLPLINGIIPTPLIVSGFIIRDYILSMRACLASQLQGTASHRLFVSVSSRERSRHVVAFPPSRPRSVFVVWVWCSCSLGARSQPRKSGCALFGGGTPANTTRRLPHSYFSGSTCPRDSGKARMSIPISIIS